jgi:hypothetical protein
MGFIIWYQVQFPGIGPGGLLPLRISNDIFSGEHVVDADITLKMPSGAVAGEFQIVFTNLPASVGETLRQQQVKRAPALPGGISLPGAKNTPEPLECRIALGYFEDAPALTRPDPVMVGAVTRVETTVEDDGSLRTEVRGQEMTGFKLLNTPISADCDNTLHLDRLAARIAKTAGVELAGQADLGLAKGLYAIQTNKAMDALRELTRQTRQPVAVVIRDGTIYLGSTVGGSSGGTVELSSDTNLVKLKQMQFTEDTLDTSKPPKDRATQHATRLHYEAKTLGIPALRAGKRVKLGIPDAPTDVRVDAVTHRFSTQTGYVCDAQLVAAKPGEAVEATSGARAFADGMADFAEKVQDRRPAVDVGEVAEYQPGTRHRATLNYGQSPAQGTIAPSVQTPVDAGTQLRGQPIASPFAWHKCGLMVPVYEGMRAVLAHNRSLTNDALVTGFLWSEDPKLEPPANQPGDYWLCLPTGVAANKPVGKGVNDLTDKSGQRVIQARGLKIQVGDTLLPEVGVRPTVPPDLTGRVVVEHQSGTTITIDSGGAVTIETKGKDIVLKNGAATLSLSGPTVKVS